MSYRRPVALHVAVPAEDLSYDVVVGPGVLGRVGTEVRRAQPRVRRVMLVSDSNGMPLYGEQVRRCLQAEDLEVFMRTIPAGEASKTPDQLLALVGDMVERGLGRTDALVALGGGVVGDLAGLAAALFMRGIPFLQCPTSLLAQVDASVGGKVAVDLPEGKNLLGAFHFPRAVLVDTTVLETLPEVELGCGLAEMLKHALLFSREHFAELIEHSERIYARDPEVLARLVATSVGLKATAVSRDPLETVSGGKGRVLLNLGHTLGHAIEAASGFEVSHGRAVGLGLRAAARLSVRKGLATPELERTVTEALARLRLPTDLAPWLLGERGQAVQQALTHDKKRRTDTITYIALRDVGEPCVVPMPVSEILALLRP